MFRLTQNLEIDQIWLLGFFNKRKIPIVDADLTNQFTFSSYDVQFRTVMWERNLGSIPCSVPTITDKGDSYKDS